MSSRISARIMSSGISCFAVIPANGIYTTTVAEHLYSGETPTAASEPTWLHSSGDNPLRCLSNYELTHLIAHLEEAGRIQDIDRILSLELPTISADSPAGNNEEKGWKGLLFGVLRHFGKTKKSAKPSKSNRQRNAWHDAKSDEFADFISDIRRAWSAADKHLASGSSVNTNVALNLQIRCMLVSASFRAASKNLAPGLIPPLVQYFSFR